MAASSSANTFLIVYFPVLPFASRSHHSGFQMHAQLKVLPAACEVSAVCLQVRTEATRRQDRLPDDSFDHTLPWRRVHQEGQVTGRPSWPAGRLLCCCRWQAALQTR